MWLALDRGGALGVVAVRLADSLPAFFFGLHGGIAADRWSRRRLMVGADLVRCATLVPVALAGLSGPLPLWGLIAAAFALEAATSTSPPPTAPPSRRSSTVMRTRSRSAAGRSPPRC